MLTKRIIPCLDIKDGRTVKGVNFEQIRDAGDPIELAALYASQGADELVFLDITATIEQRKTLSALVHQIAHHINIPFTVGGGIKTEATLKTVLDTGATYATIGSLAVKESATFEEWIERFGANIFMLGADVHAEKIAVGGWLEKTEIDVYDFIGSYMNKGVTQLFCTDIQKDGKLEGPSIELYQKI